jgi:hypothetical protein
MDTDTLRRQQEEVREADRTGELPVVCQHLPWETAAEHAKFHYFLLCPRPRNVRKAYRLYCQDNGIEPKKDPPSSWYRLYRGEYLAFRRAEKWLRAIERAEKVHGRVPDWERLAAAAHASGKLGQYEGEIGEVMDDLILIEWAFYSLAIDKNGDPIPGMATWDERTAAYWEAVERGKADPPAGL